MRTCAANGKNPLHTGYWHAVAGVERSHHGRLQGGKVQKDKRDGSAHVVIGSRSRGSRGQRLGQSDWFFQMLRPLLRHGGASKRHPREWAIRAPCSNSSKLCDDEMITFGE